MATKDIADYTYEELKAAAEEKKQAKISQLTKELQEAEQLVATKRSELSSLTDIIIEEPKRRGRKPGSKNRAPIGKPSGPKSKRSGHTAKEAILAVLEKGAATSKEITASTKLNPGSINQALVVLKRDKIIKHDGKRGGRYSVGK
jgi:16S rRNA G1207 methylase RsmC